MAAQKEKDKQVESVLHKILHELKILYANHAPQLKPRTVPRPLQSDTESVDPVEDMYNILEGSAIIPFLEVSTMTGEGSAIILFLEVSTMVVEGSAIILFRK